MRKIRANIDSRHKRLPIAKHYRTVGGCTRLRATLNTLFITHPYQRDRALVPPNQRFKPAEMAGKPPPHGAFLRYG
jgi:hypothetical protein